LSSLRIAPKNHKKGIWKAPVTKIYQRDHNNNEVKKKRGRKTGLEKEIGLEG